MTCEQATEQILDWIDGTLDDGQKKLVEEHVASCASCRREAGESGETWVMMGDLAEPRVSERQRERFFAMLESQQGRAEAKRTPGGAIAWLESLRPGRPLFQAALALGMLVLGMGLGLRLSPRAGGQDEITELRAEMKSMERSIVLSLLENRSASERLRAVSLTQSGGPDDSVIEALLQVITSDPSVNVRLAALDVLSRMAERPDVQERLLEAFPRQNSPTMTVAMADVLMAVDGPRSRAVIESAMSRKELPDDVRSYLENSLREEH